MLVYFGLPGCKKRCWLRPWPCTIGEGPQSFETVRQEKHTLTIKPICWSGTNKTIRLSGSGQRRVLPKTHSYSPISYIACFTVSSSLYHSRLTTSLWRGYFVISDCVLELNLLRIMQDKMWWQSTRVSVSVLLDNLRNMVSNPGLSRWPSGRRWEVPFWKYDLWNCFSMLDVMVEAQRAFRIFLNVSCSSDQEAVLIEVISKMTGFKTSTEPVSLLHHHRATLFRIWHSKSCQIPWSWMIYFNLCSFSVGISYPTWINNCLNSTWPQISAALLLTLQLVSALPTHSRFNRRAVFDSENSFAGRGEEGLGWSSLVRRSPVASPCSLLDLDDAQQREFNVICDCYC